MLILPPPIPGCVVAPVHMGDAKITTAQYDYVVSIWLRPAYFRVAILKGSGAVRVVHSDLLAQQRALEELGFFANRAAAVTSWS